jgi:hypothetical protein
MFSRDQLKRAASLTEEDFAQLGKCRRRRTSFRSTIYWPKSTTLSHSMGLTCSSRETSIALATGSHSLRTREISHADGPRFSLPRRALQQTYSNAEAATVRRRRAKRVVLSV